MQDLFHLVLDLLFVSRYYPTFITVTQWFISKKERWSDLFSARLAPLVCHLNCLDGKKEGMFSALGICGISHVPFFWKAPQGLVVFPWIQKIIASQAGCCTPQADWSQSCQRHHSHHSPAFLDPRPLIPSIPAEWKTARVCPDGKYRIFGWSEGYWHGTAVSSRCVKAPIHRPFSSKVVTSALPLKEEGREGGREGECVYGVNSFKTLESLTNSREPSEKDWARAEPRLGWLLLRALRDRDFFFFFIHFCLNEVSDPPPRKWHIYHPGDLCTPRLWGSSSIWRGQIWLQIYPCNLSPALHLQTVFSIKVDAVLLNLWRHRNGRKWQHQAPRKHLDSFGVEITRTK